jgi:hypothetical protein
MGSRWLRLSLALLALGVTGLPARADGPGLEVAVLKKVKAATAHLEVSLPDGSTVEGSGFFTEEPGVVLTNAHVLGMLDADSRPPLKVAVTINSGETDSRTVTGKLLGVDRGSDLALLRVEGKDLPEPLAVVPAQDLNETAEVYIFGFPLGKRLGKNITVSRSSVSSLRKENGRLKQIQVNGGMHPGNSGGPVVNGKGEVVGVAVSVITGTALHFAIPGETVQTFLNGRLVGLGAELGYKDGDKIKMVFRLTAVDPLGRLKDMKLDTWIAEPGTRHRPASTTEPKPLPGDSEHQSVDVKYEKKESTMVELALPPQDDPKKNYWIQPSFVNGTSKRSWYGAWAPSLGTPVERKEVTIRYKPRLDTTQMTELANEGSFRVLVGGEEHSLAINSKCIVGERSAAQKSGEVLPIHIDYRNFALTVLEDKKVVKGDDDLKRHLNNMRFLSADLEMEDNGGVAKARGDLSKVPKASRDFLGDLSDQVLQGLELIAVPLPDGTLKPLQSWKVQRTVLLGNAVLGVPAQADIKYTYLGTRLYNKREIAFLDVKGTVKGVRGNGLNVGGTVGGGSQVALDTGEVLSATMDFKADMDVELKDKEGKAKLIGTLVVRVRRDLPQATKPAEKPKNN